MEKIVASAVRSHSFDAGSMKELSTQMNAWFKENSRCELICPPQVQTNGRPTAIVFYVEVPEPSSPGAPCD